MGNMGLAAPVQVLPVVAGDSITQTIEGAVRLAPFRKNIVCDARLDVFSFFVPHRIAYANRQVSPDVFDGDTGMKKWMDFIARYDRTGDHPVKPVTLPTYECPFDFLPGVRKNDVVPKWLITGYYWIWNRYFKHVDYPARVFPTITTEPISDIEKMCGFPAPRLPALWNVGLFSEDNNPARGEGRVKVENNSWSLLDEAYERGQYRSLQSAKWFGRYYADRLRSGWGGHASASVDIRPILLARSSHWMSGHNVLGTAPENQASAIGRVEKSIRHHLPLKHFGEHGAIWTIMLPRFPVVHTEEMHFLHKVSTYDELSGDPDVITNMAPRTMKKSELFRTTDGSLVNEIPFAEWYRFQPSTVHSKIKDVQGMPFMTQIPPTRESHFMHHADDYNHMFVSNQLAQWNTSLVFSTRAKRVIPPSSYSIFAGAEVRNS